MKQLEVMHAQLLTYLGFVLACIFSTAVQSATVSDLLITEIMANPTAVSDTQGEWFELFNPTSESVDLSNIVLSDDGNNSHIISTGNSLLVTPGSYFVMARSGDASTNGGLIADYVYNSFSLGNTRDQIIFSDDAGELLRLNYDAGFVPTGGSMELIDAVMLPSNYAATTTAYGLGDLGTPGAAGSFVQPIAAVPLPGAAWLMGSGLLGLIGFGRKHLT